MRVAIVNDVALACEALRRVVLTVPGCSVAWTAGDGEEALSRALEDRPDLILMDLLMPRVGGAEATRRIMAQAPCAIVVVTASVSDHMPQVYEAMGAGALDAVDVPVLGPRGEVAGASALVEKLAVVSKLIGPPPRLASPRPGGRPPLVLVGVSTGGPKALGDLLAGAPEGWDACVVIVQHMDVGFLPTLARMLGDRTGHAVELARDGDAPAPGRWLLANSGDHLAMNARGRLYYTAEPVAASFRPSADVLFATAAAHWPEPGAAALLTGMGRDGAQGLLALRRAGWLTVAQDEGTSVVWGMPRVAAEIGAASLVLPIQKIAAALAGAAAVRL